MKNYIYTFKGLLHIFNMERQLDLQTIIKFLSNNEVEINDIYSKENINQKYLEHYNSKHFCKFNNYFDGNVDRIGINTKVDDSLYFTIFYLIIDNFTKLNNKEQNNFIKKFDAEFVNDIKSKNIDVSTLDDIDKKIYFLSCFLKINIFIFSYSSNIITIHYSEDYFVKYKKNIFINNVEDRYYPLTYKDGNGFNFQYNSTILENILIDYKNIKAYSIKDSKEFKLCDSIYKILDSFKNIDTYNIIDYMDDSDSENVDLDNLSEKLDILEDKISDNNDFVITDTESKVNKNKEKDIIIKTIKESSDSKLKNLKKNKLLEYLKEVNIQKYNEKLTKDNIIKYLRDNTTVKEI